jgi:hypothetical protein
MYWQYISGCERQIYSYLEKNGLGVWSVPGGIERPWDYRHRK